MELGRLQEDVMAKLSSLRTEHEATEEKYEELVKVATILGLDHKNLRRSAEHDPAPSCSESKESRSPEKSKSASITPNTQVDFLLLLVGKKTLKPSLAYSLCTMIYLTQGSQCECGYFFNSSRSHT